MKKYICTRESWGYNTNLQLCSLREAYRLAKQIERETFHNDSRLIEQVVLVINLCGLSLSQLLGQNAEYTGSRVPSPLDLFDYVMRGKVNPPVLAELRQRFRAFVELYDACRHFGPPKHEKILRLDKSIAKESMGLTLEIWGLVCDDEIRPDSIRAVVDDLIENLDEFGYGDFRS